ncbi:MAG: bifunctional diaminohydroxyphosphoribosylaminopyrimidine deaminase/5-amino-6-(5-phosphoribosylamino)uracil reductase RibD [Nitrospirota bacterium]|nr:bifunctional diaminohydroxyphosphoribosylaminopyrimidine deaminase/5-amino-6-(5-phosphoribosylamino)uracil reductase RibD [Nitrospirota bacterium]
MTFSDTDRRWMGRALALARRALGRTSPNPLVGAVLVKGGRLIAEGYHRGPGTPHAEAVALERAGKRARGATLYVTLEPCSHTAKRTPPCAPRVAAAGLARMVVAMADPNPQVSGSGLAHLAATGLKVETGCLEAPAAALNAPYIRAMSTGLPWVTLKIAQTLDGRVATASGHSQWITGEAARRHGHRMRATHDVILVGAGTVRADDPRLTCRLPRGRNPLRVVVDSRLSTIPAARLLTAAPPGPTILATTDAAPVERRRALEAAGATVLELPASGDRVDLTALMRHLAESGHHRVLCEGGPRLSAALLSAVLVDRVACFVAPRLMGGDDARGAVGGPSPLTVDDCTRLTPFSIRRLGDDLLLTADVIR